MIETESLRLIYQYLYSKITGPTDYKFQNTPQSIKISDTFILLLSKNYNLHSLGTHFLWRYGLFQFNYWNDLQITSFNQKINFSFIFGKKAVARFLERDQEFDYQIEEYNIITKYRLRYSEFANTDELQPAYQDTVRLLNHNTDAGFNTCMTMTTLYNHKEQACNTCIYQTDCKAVLKNNYPNIYKMRGYGG